MEHAWKINELKHTHTHTHTLYICTEVLTAHHVLTEQHTRH